MRIIDRYVLGQFIKIVVIGIVAFLVIYLVIDFFENIGKFIDKGTSSMTIVKLYLYKLPAILNLILPVAMLLASLFCLGRLSRNSELSAIIAAGIPLMRILLPIIIFSALVSMATYVFNEQVITRANRALEQLERYELNKETRSNSTVRHNIHKIGEDGTLYWAESYFISQQRFENLVLLRYENSQLKEYINAKHAFWSAGHWRLVQGYHHSFALSSGQERPEEGTYHFEHLDMEELAETPDDFCEDERNPDIMEARELRNYIVEQTSAGTNVDRLWVDLHVKSSFPWSNLLIVLLGCALSASKRRISMASGFGLTVAIAFVYLIFLQVGLSLGHNHTLPPLLAAWVGNIVFFLVGVVLLARASR
ncbi:MAG: YjgP/YjgQ family permease [bacterium]|nr:YjgP/YjgQ family permease [bacterium]